MKRLLISLWLGGAALYTVNTFLVTGVIRPPDDAKLALAHSAQNLKDNERDVRSWGSHLSHVAAREQNAPGLAQDNYLLRMLSHVEHRRWNISAALRNAELLARRVAGITPPAEPSGVA